MEVAKIEGVDAVIRALERHAAAIFPSGAEVKGASVAVGYTASYALYVHEMRMKHHGKRRPKSRAGGSYWAGRTKNKYLEDPARELAGSGELARIASEACLRGAKLQQAIYLAGLRLQRESQKQCPVMTGNLRASAFTRKE